MESRSTAGDESDRVAASPTVDHGHLVLPQHRTLTVAARTENLAELRAFAREVFQAAGVSEPRARHMVLAVDEAVTSIIYESAECARAEGGQETPCDSEIEVTIDVDSIRMLVIVRDTRTEFQSDLPLKPLRRETTRRDGSGDRVSGDVGTARRTPSHELGVFLMRQLLDEVNYTFRRGFQNHLELLKFLY